MVRFEQAPSSDSALADALDASNPQTIIRGVATIENLKLRFFIVTSFGQEQFDVLGGNFNGRQLLSLSSVRFAITVLESACW
jgi:hypothetical protein